MSFNVAGLVTYSKEVGYDFMRAAIYKGQTSKYIRKVSGVGTSFKIPQISNTITLQADGCSLSSSGSTAFAQVTCTPCPLAYVNDLCMKDLKDYFTAEYLPASQMEGENMGTFEQVILEDITDRLALEIDKILWNGNSTIGCSGFFNKIDGTYSGSVNTITYAAATGGTTTLNIKGLVDEFVIACDFATKANPTSLWMSPSNYQKLILAHRDALQHQPIGDNIEGFVVPGSLGVVARPTAGIITDTRMVATWDKNMVLGTRDENDLTKLEVKYDDFDQLVRIYGAWAQDSVITYPAQVWTWKI